jgi:hypothetical protein
MSGRGQKGKALSQCKPIVLSGLLVRKRKKKGILTGYIGLAFISETLDDEVLEGASVAKGGKAPEAPAKRLRGSEGEVSLRREGRNGTYLIGSGQIPHPLLGF